MNRSTGRPRLDARRKVAVLGGSIAAMSGVAAMLSQNHPQVFWAYGAFLLVAIAYVVAQMVKVKRMERERKAATRGAQA